jgi:lipopolysaccharide transport system permease protein
MIIQLEQELPASVVDVAKVDASKGGPSTDRYRPSERIRIIEPGNASLRHVVRDLWSHRELLYFLTWRDIKVRYKQTALGVFWAVIQPLLSMVVLSIVFGRLSGIAGNVGKAPYPVFVYSGLLPWTFFAGTLAAAGNSVVGNANLVTKVRFPRIALPIASVLAGLVDLGISFLVLLGLMVWFHVAITWQILLVPFLVLGTAAIAYGFGAIFASLTVTYRDFRYVIPFMTQVWMFLTPVIYPVSAVPKNWQWLISVNPLSGWLSAFRAVLLGNKMDWTQLGISATVTLLVMFAGTYYFRISERRFADVI